MGEGLTDTSFSYVQFKFYIFIAGKQLFCFVDVVFVNMHIPQIQGDGF